MPRKGKRLFSSSNGLPHHRIGCVYQQGALPQAKLQIADAIDFAQCPADFVFFHYAIHIGNAQPLPRGSGQRRIQIGWRMRMVVMVMVMMMAMAFFMGVASMRIAGCLAHRLVF